LAASGNDAGSGAQASCGGAWSCDAERSTPPEHDLRESLEYADAAADIRERMASRWLLAMTAVQGPIAVPDAISRCEGWASVDGATHPGVLTELARLHAMAGEFDRARELDATARTEFVERMRTRRMRMFLAESTATVELLAGDPAAAEAALGQALALGQQTNEHDHISQAPAGSRSCSSTAPTATVPRPWIWPRSAPRAPWRWTPRCPGAARCAPAAGSAPPSRPGWSGASPAGTRRTVNANRPRRVERHAQSRVPTRIGPCRPPQAPDQ
jgi:hypothetical protein